MSKSGTAVTPQAVLRLKPRNDRRLKAGHLWIYSNELDLQAAPIKGLPMGALVQVESAEGRSMGLATVSPNNLICARLLTRDNKATINQNWFARRLERAAELRAQWFDKPYYRLVHGEGDGLPGLIIDRFGDYFVVQTGSAGMDACRELIVAALVKQFGAVGVLLKNDSRGRELEGLERTVELAHGDFPEQVLLEENNTRFQIEPRTGQKTGWFFDHRESRALLQRLAKGQRVLDTFSYCGGWGVEAAVAGADQVICLDASAKAVAQVEHNAALNGVADRVQGLEGQAFETMKALLDAGERFDIVVADPPAFIQRKRDHAQGVKAYHRLNELAVRLLNRGGLLVSASCSMQLARAELMDVVRSSGRHHDRSVQVVAQGGQGPDHPIHPAIPETEYLKTLFCRVDNSF